MATARTAQQKKRFLDAYAEVGTITHAARVAGIGRRTHYNWLVEDADYAQAFTDAEQAVADQLEREAIRRAVNGSDTLLIFLLKGLRPGRYRDRIQTEQTVTVTQVDTFEAAIRELEAELGRRGGGSPVAEQPASPPDRT